MRVLVTGGYGVLGYHLCKKLASITGYEFAIVDNKDSWDFEEPYENIEPNDYFEDNFRLGFARFKPDKVIHCAEFSDPQIAMSEHMAYTNVGFTTQVVHTCSAKGVRCIIPAWFEFVSNGQYKYIWSKTVAWRASVSESFNKGNAVNSVVYLPRIISPYQNGNNFGSVVKRVYNSIVDNRILFIHDSEIPDGVRATVPWCSHELAVEAIMRMMLRNTRENYREPGFEFPVINIIEYIAYQLGVTTVVAHYQGQSITISSSTKKHLKSYSNELRRTFKKLQPLIDGAIDVWERTTTS